MVGGGGGGGGGGGASAPLCSSGYLQFDVSQKYEEEISHWWAQHQRDNMRRKSPTGGPSTRGTI